MEKILQKQDGHENKTFSPVSKLSNLLSSNLISVGIGEKGWHSKIKGVTMCDKLESLKYSDT